MLHLVSPAGILRYYTKIRASLGLPLWIQSFFYLALRLRFLARRFVPRRFSRDRGIEPDPDRDVVTTLRKAWHSPLGNPLPRALDRAIRPALLMPKGRDRLQQ